MAIKTLVESPVTHDPAKSVKFYVSLGFHHFKLDGRNAFTDGKVVVILNVERTTRTSLRFIQDFEPVQNRVSKVAQMTEISSQRSVCTDPNGVHIVFEKSSSIETGEVPNSILGSFAGLSIETGEIERSVRFWESLGYSPSMGGIDQGWLTLEASDCIGVSLMKIGSCPHLFYSPGLTYFNSGKNEKHIADIRNAGIELVEEITCFNEKGIVDNVILRDPGGTGFFIFND